MLNRIYFKRGVCIKWSLNHLLTGWKIHRFLPLNGTIKHNQSCIWYTASNNILAYCYFPFFLYSQGVTSYFVVILNNLYNNHTIMNAQGSFTWDKVIRPWTWLSFSGSVEVENAGSLTSICHCRTGSFSLHYILLLAVIYVGAHGGKLIEALQYKLEGCRFNFQWCY
jgi:hypothetical protein